MPWDDPVDEALRTGVRRLAQLRRSSDALARGGIRYAYVDTDVIAFLRETPGERLVVLAAREAHEPVRLALDATSLETLYGENARIEAGVATLPAEGPSFHIWRLT
jgi:alpha-glucosidase